MEPGPQFHQLAMFMTAHELKHDVESGDAPGWGSEREMWAHKRRAANLPHSGYGGHSLRQDIAQHGVKMPVEVWHDKELKRPLLANGHHRTAVAHDMDPKTLLPVMHNEADPRYMVTRGGAL